MNVDIVIVSYNSAPHLGRCLASLPRTHSTDAGAGAMTVTVTVTVIDNASSDDSAAIARAAGARVVVNPANVGFAAAANQGARLGHHELVLLLNPDAELGLGTLDALRAALVADPGLAVVSPRVVRPDGSEERVFWPFPSAARAWAEALGLHRVGTSTDVTDVTDVTDGPDGPEPTGFVIGACFLVRRAAFEQMGGFDPRFWLYAEESDLCRRLHDAGWRVAVISPSGRTASERLDGTAARHIGGARSAGVEAVTSEHFARGAELFVAKHDGRAALVSLRLAQVVGSVPRSIVLRDRAKREVHRFRLQRAARLLLTHPLTVPTHRPGPATAEAPGTARDLVICSLEQWDDVWRRNQFLVRELLALDPGRRVLFVEPPFDAVHEARRRSGRARARGLRPLPTDPRIVRFEPLKIWPRVAGPMADRSLRRQVRRAAAAVGVDDPTLWVNDAAYAGLASQTGWPSLYDVTDDWTEAGDGARATRRIEDREWELFGECDRVVVCSPGLAASRRSLRPDLVVIPNGVDGEHLTRPRPRPADLPAGANAVYVGTLHHDRLDVDLVVRLAQARPALAVTLVGPDALGATNRDRLQALANVHLLGARPYDDVPGYLQHAAVVIVPHVVSPFTDSLDPIKAYECLAVGRTTVATAVAGFRDLTEPIRVVTRDAFVAAVLVAIDDPTELVPGTPPSWAERAARFDTELGLARDVEARRRVAQRVVFVDHCALLSGGELALLRTLPALDGVEAHVILGEHGPLESRLTDIGVTVEVLPLDRDLAATRKDDVADLSVQRQRIAAAARATWALRRRLRQLQPDVVHTNSLKAAVYGGVAGRLAGVPVVWHLRDRIAPDYLPAPAVAVIRALARVVPQAIIANSQVTLDTIGAGPRRQLRVVVHDAVAPPTSRTVPAHDGFRVVMVGRLTPWKGQRIFLEALAEAFGDEPFHASIIGSALFGEDAYRHELERIIAARGLGGRVEMTGFVEDVDGALAAADCLVHASVIAEPFGLVVVEGMAAGLPVIAAEGGPSEIITDGVDGLLYPPGDVAALAGLLRRVAGDPALRHRLGTAARLRAADFSPARTATGMQAVFDAVGRHRRSRPASSATGQPAARRWPGRPRR